MMDSHKLMQRSFAMNFMVIEKYCYSNKAKIVELPIFGLMMYLALVVNQDYMTVVIVL